MTTHAGRALLATALSDAARTPELAEIKRVLFEDRFRRAEAVVTRAVERGELPADRAVDVALAAAHARALSAP